MGLSILMAQKSKGRSVASNLDVRHTSEGLVDYDFGYRKTKRRWPFRIFLLPGMKDASFLNYGIVSYVLNKIFCQAL